MLFEVAAVSVGAHLRNTTDMISYFFMIEAEQVGYGDIILQYKY